LTLDKLDGTTILRQDRVPAEELHALWAKAMRCSCGGSRSCEACWWFDRIRRVRGDSAIRLFLGLREPEGPVYRPG
jgi:hypothetical protein